jgi:hypothetical protein
MANFCKSEACPSSQELLDFQNGDLPLDSGVDIRLHLPSCEFCSAEVDFYSHYPQTRDEELIDNAESSQIPAPLFELAEALLKNRHADSASLNALLSENEGFSLDKF